MAGFGEGDGAVMRNYKNILVINLMHIGDLMLATPVLRTLRANYPQAKISILVDKKLADLVRCNKHIDECLLIDKKGKDDKLTNFIKYIGEIRKNILIWLSIFIVTNVLQPLRPLVVLIPL